MIGVLFIYVKLMYNYILLTFLICSFLALESLMPPPVRDGGNMKMTKRAGAMGGVAAGGGF